MYLFHVNRKSIFCGRKLSWGSVGSFKRAARAQTWKNTIENQYFSWWSRIFVPKPIIPLRTSPKKSKKRQAKTTLQQCVVVHDKGSILIPRVWIPYCYGSRQVAVWRDCRCSLHRITHTSHTYHPCGLGGWWNLHNPGQTPGAIPPLHAQLTLNTYVRRYADYNMCMVACTESSCFACRFAWL